VGATKRPSYRVVAIDRRRARDGRALEILGFYDPLTDPATVRLETEKIKAWIGKGAQPSETVVKLMRQAEGAAKPAAGEAAAPKRARTRKPKTAKEESPAAEAEKAEAEKAEA
jgi:small subunit ribosomal protein S16